MALDQSALLEVLDALKVADVGDRVRQAAETVYQALIEAELTETIGAALHERTSAHQPAQRAPHPDAVDHGRRSGAADPEAAHRLVLPVAVGAPPPGGPGVVRGGDGGLPARRVTRKVDDLVKALGADTGISKSEVSRICADLDQEVGAFRDRSLADQPFPYVFLDATYCKARVNHRVVSQAVVIATGVRADGWREVLGFAVGDSEDGAFWTAFLRSLKARGLGGVQLVISDAHTGLKQAISAVLLGAAWQRCRVHWSCKETTCRFELGHGKMRYALRGTAGQLARRFEVLLPYLNERQQRLALATETRSRAWRYPCRGRGERGQRDNSKRGVAELESGEDSFRSGERVEPVVDGKRVDQHDPELTRVLLGLVEPDERGDPMSPLRWTTKSLRHLAEQLVQQGHPVSAPTVGRLLRDNGFSLQGTAKRWKAPSTPIGTPSSPISTSRSRPTRLPVSR